MRYGQLLPFFKMAEEDTATKKNPELWSKAKSEAKAQLGGKWSARAAQLAVQKYKAQGGKYEGKKPSASKNSLVKWTKQDWQTRPGTPEKAERGGVTHRYLPKAKWESLSKKEQVATDRKKIEGDKKGKEIVPNTPKARVKTSAELRSFADELEKIANRNTKNKERNEQLMLAGTGIGTVALTPKLLDATSSLAGSALESDKPTADVSLLKKLKDRAKGIGVNTYTESNPIRSRYLPFGNPFLGKKPSIFASGPATFSHELGHSLIHKNLYRGSKAPYLVRGLSNALSPVAGAVGGFAAGASDGDSTQKNVMTALPLLANAPMLADEAGASLVGLRELARAGASKKQIAKAGLRMLPAFGTYAVQPIKTLGVSLASRAAGEKYRELRGKKNKSKGHE